MKLIFVAALGAIFQELMHWYGMRHEIIAKGISANKIGVYIYLLIMTIVVAASSAGTYLWFDGRRYPPPLIDVLAFGAAFPALFKTLVKGALKSGDNTTLGAVSEIKNITRKYFS